MLELKTTVSAKGQVVIPKAVRNALGIHDGSELLIHLRDDNVLELSATKRNIRMFFGRCKSIEGAPSTVSISPDDTLIMKAVEENDKATRGS